MSEKALPDFDPAEFPLGGIETVTFYKRDELTTDLICCDVTVFGRNHFFHEEHSSWSGLLAHISTLPGFRSDWQEHVVLPPFEVREFVAFSR